MDREMILAALFMLIGLASIGRFFFLFKTKPEEVGSILLLLFSISTVLSIALVLISLPSKLYE